MVNILCLTLGIRCQVDEICPLLRYCAASSGNSLTMFQDNLSVPSSRVNCMTIEVGADRLSRNVGNSQSTLHNNPKERRSLIYLGESLKSRTYYVF